VALLWQGHTAFGLRYNAVIERRPHGLAPRIQMQSIPLLITSAIHVSAPGTKLDDPNERLELTLKGIERWLAMPSVHSLVIVDGSGFDYSAQVSELNRVAEKQVEFLAFRNNAERVRVQGKGYGEGEIVLHALKHSETLMKAKFFAKCTAKLYVRNYARCLAVFNSKFMCGVYGKNSIRCLDTRFYISSREFWLKYFADAHVRVDDPRGYYIEHSYLDRLRENGIRGFTLPVPPLIEGRSGSDNIEYTVPSLYRRAARRVRFFVFNKIY
jgi:hypothetical protein